MDYSPIVNEALKGLLSSCSSSNEDCSPKQIGLTKSPNIAEELFYTGTCHYRNEAYEQSVEY